MLYWASETSDYLSQEGLEDRTYSDVEQLAKEYAAYKPDLITREIDDPAWLEFLGTRGKAEVSVFSFSEERIKALKEKILIGTRGEGEKHTKGLGVSRRDMVDVAGDGPPHGIGCFNGVLLTPRGLYNIVQIELSDNYPQGQAVVPVEGFSDNPICKGDRLETVLAGGVVALDKKSEGYNRKRDGSHFEILRKDGKYKVQFDSSGVVENVTRESHGLEEINVSEMPDFRDYDDFEVSEAVQMALNSGNVNITFKETKDGKTPEEVKRIIIAEAPGALAKLDLSNVHREFNYTGPNRELVITWQLLGTMLHIPKSDKKFAHTPYPSFKYYPEREEAFINVEVLP